jgi:hypothetical protein
MKYILILIVYSTNGVASPGNSAVTSVTNGAASAAMQEFDDLDACTAAEKTIEGLTYPITCPLSMTCVPKASSSRRLPAAIEAGTRRGSSRG